MNPVATVCVVDDDPSLRLGLARLLGTAGYAVETFDSADAFLAKPRPSGSRCLVLDVNLPGLDGLGLQEQMGAGGDCLPIIFISGDSDIPISVRAMKAGAVDFLTKPFDAEALLSAVMAAIARHTAVSERSAARELVHAHMERLTPREREVFPQLLTGKLNKQIAAILGITEKTVKVHRAQVLRKFEVHSVAELVRIAALLEITP